jgi:hypothetical protein
MQSKLAKAIIADNAKPIAGPLLALAADMAADSNGEEMLQWLDPIYIGEYLGNMILEAQSQGEPLNSYIGGANLAFCHLAYLQLAILNGPLGGHNLPPFLRQAGQAIAAEMGMLIAEKFC